MKKFVTVTVLGMMALGMAAGAADFEYNTWLKEACKVHTPVQKPEDDYEHYYETHNALVGYDDKMPSPSDVHEVKSVDGVHERVTWHGKKDLYTITPSVHYRDGEAR
jgi:hypothetical protein